jgi:hypothetical protein
MTPIDCKMTPHIPAPVIGDAASSRQIVRSSTFKTTRSRLIERAGIRSLVSGTDDLVVRLIAGTSHYRLVDGSVAIAVQHMDTHKDLSPEIARYVLEVLAHGFHDYPTRECVRRFLRFIPETRGRERSGRALSGAERTQRWRSQNR